MIPSSPEPPAASPPPIAIGSQVFLQRDPYPQHGPWIVLDTEDMSRHMVLCLRQKYYPQDLYRAVWLHREDLSREPWPVEIPAPPRPARPSKPTLPAKP